MRGYSYYQPFYESAAFEAGKPLGWSPEYCKTIAYETFKALYCKSTVHNPMTLSVSPAIDQVWHQLLLETETYSKMCADLFHRFIHHSAKTMLDDIEEKHKRQAECMATYERCFGPISAPECWEYEKKSIKTYKKKTRKRPRNEDDDEKEHVISVITLLGKSHRIDYDPKESVHDVMLKIQDYTNYSPDQQRLIYAGKSMDPKKLMGDYNIKPFANIHLIARLKGC